MAEVHWLPGIITLLVAAGVGALAVALMRRSESQSPASIGDSRDAATRQLLLDDLRQRKQQLLRALRDAQDRSGGSEIDPLELHDLELRAARAFRDLHEAEQAHQPRTSGADMSDEAPGAPAPTPQAASTSSGSFAAFKWMAVGAFLPLVAISLYFGVSERKDEMTPMTGGNPALSGPMSPGPTPQSGQPGGAVAGVPPDLRPQESPALDRARALVAANPDDPEAWAALGWMLVEAQGWIDVFETARRLRELAPQHPDGFVLQASVRIAMGQGEIAQQLVTDALTIDPSHVQALSFQGALAMRRGDRSAAAAAWERARSAAGPGKGFEELIAMAQSDAPTPAMPSGHPTTSPPATAPQGQAPSTERAADDAITGRVVLAEGASFEGSGVLFIIARAKGVSAGPPAAAKRLSVQSFPIDYSISSADAMMGGTLPPEVTLTARLDSDGNAGTRSANDLTATPVDVATGSSAVLLKLHSAQ